MKNLSTSFLLFFIIIPSCYIQAQVYENFRFERNLSIIATDSLGNPYLFPWTGGLNACQFSKIDMDMDGAKDLFVFDRHGNRIITFINDEIPNQSSYAYAPEYRLLFPELHDCVNLIDYNCDGKEDIFTYSNGGLAVYKNVSDTSLKFKLITNLLLSFQYSSYINLFTSSVDYPGIIDLDNDGDLDIVTFSLVGNGKWVQFHKNLSKEKFNNCDSLDYKLVDECWGKFFENDTTNAVTLNATCPWPKPPIISSDEGMGKGSPKHYGSTICAFDMDGDLDKDVLIGDLDYPNIIYLENGGTPDSAHMVTQVYAAPANTKPVDMFSFNLARYLDVDNDDLEDLIVTPFEPIIDRPANYNSVWFYKNTGSPSAPVFTFQMENFLQKDMIDVGGGAYPVLADYDGDSLLDLFVGNFGYLDSTYYEFGNLYSIYRSQLALFKNIGTKTAPQFQLITKDFADLSQYKLCGIIPAFGDIDNDGDQDMIIGNKDGQLILFTNIAGAGDPMNFTLTQTGYQGINVGAYSAPTLANLNSDSLLDLVIGNRNGTLHYFQNAGTKTSPLFQYVTDSLGHVAVADNFYSYYGYSVPCFYKDSAGVFKLMVASESGIITFYKDIENNLAGTFTLADTVSYNLSNKNLRIYEGIRSGITVGDLNKDGYHDLIVGNFSGGLNYFNGVKPHIINTLETDNQTAIQDLSVNLFPNPAQDVLTILLDNTPAHSSLEVVITDIIGKKVYASTIQNQQRINIGIQNIPNGIYICNISVLSKNQQYFHNISRKFVVQKH